MTSKNNGTLLSEWTFLRRSERVFRYFYFFIFSVILFSSCLTVSMTNG
jgi:hypothetical protein